MPKPRKFDGVGMTLRAVMRGTIGRLVDEARADVVRGHLGSDLPWAVGLGGPVERAGARITPATISDRAALREAAVLAAPSMNAAGVTVTQEVRVQALSRQSPCPAPSTSSSCPVPPS